MKKIENLFIVFFLIVFSLMGIIYLGKTSLLLTVLTLITLIYLVYKKKIPHFGYKLFIVSFLIRLFIIIFMKVEPVSDFQTLLEASTLLAGGDTSFNQNPYFIMWGYQTGFVMYQAFILKIFNSVFILKLLNALYSSLLVLLVYLFSRKLVGEKSARLASLLYMIFILPLILNTVLTNQHLSALLIYLGLFLITNDKVQIKDYVIGGILVSIGNIIRPEGIIIITTIFVYLVLTLRKGNIKDQIIKGASFIIPYFMVGIIASNIIIITNINPSGLSNADPLWKFVLGLNYETCGSYSEEDTYVLGDEEKELELIKERLSDPKKLVSLAICKTNKQWLLDGMSWDTNTNKTIDILGISLDFKDVEKEALAFNSNLNIISIVLALFGVFYYRKDKRIEKGLIFIILTLVTFGVYTLIEIQPRYAYFIEVTIFILSAYGISAINDIIKKYIKKPR